MWTSLGLAPVGQGLSGAELHFRYFLPLVSREWRNGSNSSYNCTPFFHSLLTKGKIWRSASVEMQSALGFI